MTKNPRTKPDEAARIVGELVSGPLEGNVYNSDDGDARLVRRIRRAIRAAVKAERERCIADIMAQRQAEIDSRRAVVGPFVLDALVRRINRRNP